VKLNAAGWRAAKLHIDRVFEALSQSGLVALQDAGTTQEDGFSDCAEEFRARGGLGAGLRGFCFYTRQDLNRAKRTSQLALAFWVHRMGRRKPCHEWGSRLSMPFVRTDLSWTGTARHPCDRPFICRSPANQSMGRRVNRGDRPAAEPGNLSLPGMFRPYSCSVAGRPVGQVTRIRSVQPPAAPTSHIGYYDYATRQQGLLATEFPVGHFRGAGLPITVVAFCFSRLLSAPARPGYALLQFHLVLPCLVPFCSSSPSFHSTVRSDFSRLAFKPCPNLHMDFTDGMQMQHRGLCVDALFYG